ncbi:MAG: 2-succinylbenzoate--CoA ligase [Leptolyngbyaceae cyanobacterium bins.349]|nr:2-succinylbenzoate--CoA ligase [Leptolyngbyaceae cyanobacterium bins.349]
MATPLTLLLQRQHDDWLIGIHREDLMAIAQHTLQDLQTWQATHHPRLNPVILLNEPDPSHFLGYFIAACSCPGTVILGNPTWATAEWQQVMAQVSPDLVLGRQLPNTQPAHPAPSPPPPISSSPPPLPLILIPTGGSSGSIRFAMHTWDTLTASITGFQQHFAMTPINACCVLPLYHVSGLMQFLRSLLSGGTFAIAPYKALQSGSFPPLPQRPFFLSLVPTQLHRLLSAPGPASPTNAPTLYPPTPLSAFTVLLGGAPAWNELLEQARQHQVRLAPTYGMTETASQIATLRPEEFLQGRSGCGRVLPHAHVTIRDAAGNELGPHQIGQVTIAAQSLMLGYFPDLRDRSEFSPADLGYFDDAGYLHIVGRQDGTIITGGENVFPAEVEAAIWATGLVQDVCVVGIPDPEWGQVVTAVYVPMQVESLEAIKVAIAPRLSRYKHPKHWLAVAKIPRNAQGKVNRLQVMALISATLHTSASTS